MKNEWFKKPSLTFREAAWILLGVDPDAVGETNKVKPSEIPRQERVSETVSSLFSSYLALLEKMFRDVALGRLPIISEPWNRFPLSFVQTNHLITWAKTGFPEAKEAFAQCGIFGIPLPPPPSEWSSPAGEPPTLAWMRECMTHHAAERKISPYFKKEIAQLHQWATTRFPNAPPPVLNESEKALRDLYRTLRNLPALEF